MCSRPPNARSGPHARRGHGRQAPVGSRGRPDLHTWLARATRLAAATEREDRTPRSRPYVNGRISGAGADMGRRGCRHRAGGRRRMPRGALRDALCRHPSLVSPAAGDGSSAHAHPDLHTSCSRGRPGPRGCQGVPVGAGGWLRGCCGSSRGCCGSLRGCCGSFRGCWRLARAGDPASPTWTSTAPARAGDPATRPVSYTHLTLPTSVLMCRSRWSPYH